MDLALELGMTVAQLRASMLEGELTQWQRYANKKLLPTRRMEFYLARVAQSMGGGKLADYMLDTQEEKPLTVEEMRETMGFAPRGKRKAK